MHAFLKPFLIISLLLITTNVIVKEGVTQRNAMSMSTMTDTSSTLDLLVLSHDMATIQANTILRDVIHRIPKHLNTTLNTDESPSSLVSNSLAVLANGVELIIELRSGDDLNGRFAAYAPIGHTGSERIYLNADWLNEGVGHDWLEQVLLEEIGHALWYRSHEDYQLGDHGALFAAQTLDWNMSDGQVSMLENEYDWHLISIDGIEIGVHFASLNFSNAYAVYTDVVNGNTFVADKESNRHHIDFTSLNSALIDDEKIDSRFSGNDVVTKLEVNGNTYYGWVSRPVKSGGIIRGFYFWSDPDFNTLAAATNDGNADADRNALDNFGFVLVVDQAYFDGLPVEETIAGVDYKFVGSSSDPVATALNSLIPPNTAPVATNDESDITLSAGSLNGPALEAGGLDNAIAGANAIGNVLTNDSDPEGDIITVSRFGTSSASGTVSASTTSANGLTVTGIYGSITIGSDGSYSYVVDNTNTAVESLRETTNTLSETFTYEIKDPSGLSSIATLTIIIQGANDTPKAADDYNTAKESLLPDTDANQYTGLDPLGSIAVGNVLLNDTDVDGFNETKTVLDLTGQFTVQSVADVGASTTLRFIGDNGFASVGVGRTLYYNDGGTFRAIRTVDGALITIQSKIDLGSNNYDIVLSDNPTNYRTAANDPASAVTITDFTGLPVGFASSTNDPGPTGGSMKTATVASAIQTGFSEITIVPSSEVGVVGVGMDITGNGVPSDTKVAEVQYGPGGILKVIVNKTLTSVANDVLSTSAPAGTSIGVRYGTIELNSTGDYVYTPYDNNPDLVEGQSEIEAFPYTMQDALGATSSATLYITVYGSGANDPNAVADEFTAIEAGGTLNGTAGTNPSDNVLTNDDTPSGTLVVVGIRNSSEATLTPVSTSTNKDGLYGSLSINSNGVFTYTVDNDNAVVQSLRDNTQTLTDVFIYTVENGNESAGEKLVDETTLTIIIRGRNDAPVAVNDGAVGIQSGVSNTGFNPTGNVLSNDTDVDGTVSELRVTAIRTGSIEGSGTAGVLGTALTGLYGSLTINSLGVWTYTVDPNNITIKSLTTGESLVDSFNYTATDLDGLGLSDIAVLSITIQGYDDELLINNVYVNEASDYAIFTINGLAGTEVTLQLGNDTPATDDQASISGANADIDPVFEYYNGTSWVTYDSSNLPTIPAGNTLLVRIPIEQDDLHEGTESFTLTASATGYVSATGVGAINDEGEGDVFLEANTTGIPNLPTDAGYPTLDNDTPTISVSDTTVEEGEMAIVTVSINNLSTKDISFSPILEDDTAIVGTDTDDASELEYSTDGGTNWQAVTGIMTIEAGTDEIQFRIQTTDDLLVEDEESFEFITGLITGTVTNPEGASGTITITDNDSADLSIDPVTVNEASDWAVFEVSGSAGQLISLSVDQGTGDGFADLGATPAIEYWNGSAWTSYTTGTVAIPATGPLYVRVNIEAEQDEPYEGAETFELIATNASGTDFSGTGTIVDDGTGVIFTNGDPSDPDSTITEGLDDDRGLTIDPVTVNEASDWAVFEVSGTAGQLISLSVDQGTGDGFADLGATPAIEYWNGSAWTSYTTGTVAIPATGPLYVRVNIEAEQDEPYEGAETFELIATNASGTDFSGTGTIVDDGTGVIFTNGDPSDPDSTITEGLDDDRGLTIDPVTVNEASDWAVFEVSGTAGQLISLSVDQGTGDGFADLGATPAIEYWNGSAWTSYTTGTVAIPATGPLYVRVNIEAEQDEPYEGAETFELIATNASGTDFSGTGTIVDDGTGVIFTNGDPSDPDSTITEGLDDDRGLTIDPVTVNEASDWAVFEVSGTAGQLISLSVDQGTGDGFADLGATPAIEYWNGSAWTSYTTGTVAIPATGPLYVRVNIEAEQDEPYEGAETFELIATNASGTDFSGTGTIVDDGTGVIFTNGDPSDPDSTITEGLDDDRGLTIDPVTVNEASDWAVFEVSGTAGQLISLSVDQGTGDGFADLGATPAIEYWNGSAWTSYTTGTVAIPATGPLYVRVNIEAEQDEPYEGAETFELIATNASGTDFSGTGTIVDDGTGVIFTNGDPSDPDSTITEGLDDDRGLTIDPVTVNEASDWAVFEVSGTAGQLISLSVDQGTGDGFADLGATPAIEYWNGSAWTSYTTGTVAIPATGPLYVRVNIEAEQDEPYEGAETFELIATNASGTDFSGTGTIVDDGTGVIFTNGDPSDPDSTITEGLDDDRALRVNSVTVNEASDWIVFRIQGEMDQPISLRIEQGTGLGFAELGSNPTIDYWNGAVWTRYRRDDMISIRENNQLFVRVNIEAEQDVPYEGREIFSLIATNAGGNDFSGVGTIVDDGTGKIFITEPSVSPGNPDSETTQGLDDDRVLQVNNVTVNEASDWTVFQVTGVPRQLVSLSVDQGTGSGFADLGTNPAMEYWNGSAWASYTSGMVAIPATGPLYVRVNIEAEQDEPYEGAETFVLIAKNASGTGFNGTGTIVDDGTGVIFTNGDPSNPASVVTTGLDDDRRLQVDNVTVNEASDWIVFRIVGQANQPISLRTEQGTGVGFADLGTDPSIEYWNGVQWTPYRSGATVNIRDNTQLFVRVNIEAEQDIPFEGREIFNLIATNSSSADFSGEGRIVDDGTGIIFNSDPSISPTSQNSTTTEGLDDDRVLQVNNVTVNEASDWTVFQVTGVPRQLVSLSVDQGTGSGFADLGTNPAMEYWNGSAWASYTSGMVAIPATGPLYVRVNIEAEQDEPYEGAETFVLIAKNASGTGFNGTGTIVDDGTGVIFTNGDPSNPASVVTTGLDDDRAIQVNNVTVNEASDWAVFEVSGVAGQLVSLSVDQGTGEGFADLGTAELEYWNGSVWVSYTGGMVALPASGPLYVRVNIEAEQDEPYEGAETFTLVVTNSSGNGFSGTGTIVDDGTGVIFTNGDPSDPASIVTTGLDDDRIVEVNNVTVNEASDWAVFEVSGVAGQLVSLSVDQGTGEGFADLGTAELEYWNGSVWVAYTGGMVALPATGPLYVRVNIEAEQDEPYEGAETFTLVVTNNSGNGFSGTGTIVDDGTGVIFTNGDPSDPASIVTTGLDDDRIVEVNNVTVNEASDWAVFEVSGAAGQLVSLGVSPGQTVLDAPAIEYWNGSVWVAYTGGMVALPASGPLYVRVNIEAEQDEPYEGAETFTLVVTNSSGNGFSGTGTIVDDGTGVIFTNGDPSDPASIVTTGLDDDRIVEVNNVTVNEASDWAVFEVSGVAGQLVSLSVDQGTGEGFADLGTAELEYWNGSVWVAYTGGMVALPATGPLYVRVNIEAEQDEPYEGAETFTLVVTNNSGNGFSGTGTIVDDGTGVIFTNGDPSDPASIVTTGLDDDRIVEVNNVTVNEASDWAVFEVSGVAGQLVSLSVDQGTGQGFANLGANPVIEYWNGSAWVAYTGGMVALPSTGPLYVRVNIEAEQDEPYEGAEKFTLVVTSSSGNTFSGIGTIVDDGTGVIFRNGDPTNPANIITTGLDDDRALQVNNVIVNEGSNWAVFQVTGAPGQLVSLSVEQGTGEGFADLGSVDIEYWNGSTWVAYTGGMVALPATGPLFVRVNIQAEQDDLYEGAETFTLIATNLSGNSAEGNGTIVDDGTGEYWIGDSTTPATPQQLVQAGITLDNDKEMEFIVEQNYPNPFRGQTIIPVRLPEKAVVTVQIFDVEGKLVDVLTDNRTLGIGLHRINWQANRLASGVYVYRVIARGESGKTYTKTLTLTLIN
jgi:VCBS repeat-containing protein